MSDKVREIEAALRRSEQHLAAAQRITHCGSWELDLSDLDDVDRNPLRWSDEVFRIFGYEPGEIEVTNENFFRAVHPDDRAKIHAAVAQAIERGTMYSIDHRIVRADGTVRVVHEQSEIQRDERGRPILMIGTVQDVTEQRQTEAQLAFVDRLISIGTLAAGVAHEINNPLTAVISSLEVLSRGLPDDARSRQALAHAQEGAERVRAIVRDLTVYARADTAPTLVDVRRVVDSAARMARHELVNRARFITEYDDVPLVRASEPRLAQVFLNLLRNAAHAIPDGHMIDHEVRARVWLEGERVVIAISDTGSGIAPELRSQIFAPFFTTKAAGVGTGLGLSISHRIVTEIGGELTFDSEVGKGSVFRVSLPKVHTS